MTMFHILNCLFQQEKKKYESFPVWYGAPPLLMILIYQEEYRFQKPACSSERLTCQPQAVGLAG
jgi:hypothetical protein